MFIDLFIFYLRLEGPVEERVSREPVGFPMGHLSLGSNTQHRQGTKDNHFPFVLEAMVAEADYSQT